jgi:integrase
MEQETRSIAHPSGLQGLIEDAIQALERLDYSPRTVGCYRRVWRNLLEFSRGRSSSREFSVHLANSFLEGQGISLNEVTKPLDRGQRHIRTAVSKLSEFAQHGCFICKRRITKKRALSPAMEDSLAEYLKFSAAQLRIRSSTVSNRRGDNEKFLHFLESHQVSLEDIDPRVISDFIVSLVGLSSGTVATIASNLRSFLRYLCMHGDIAEDLSQHVPTIMRQNAIPWTWSPSEVESLLSAVERTSPIGKRDYAILLLAARLGLRAGDIRKLRLEYINWDDARIEINQSKTGEMLVLPLSEEVGQALIDYLRHGRPKSQHREVFLRAHAPFDPLVCSGCFHRIMTKYRRLAGIKVPGGGHWGIHSLRHSLATRLLQVQTPFSTISGILGHSSPESTRVYAKVDIAALRSAALDPEEVFHE